MTNLLRDGAIWLESQRSANASSEVAYRRALISTTVSAGFGKTDVAVGDEFTGQVTGFVWDFIITAADLSIDEPRPGDVIEVDGRQYEVMDLPGDACWRWHDPYRISYRIHTKDMGTS